MDFKIELSMLLKNAINDNITDINDIINSIEIPQNTLMGDFAFPCFRLAKTLKKSPQIIAQNIIEKIEKKDFIEQINVESAYINFYIKKSFYSKNVLENVFIEKENYGKSNIGNGKNIVIDYSSPNIAKPFHVGHLRSTAIGNALYNIFNFVGYKSVGINHLGDWGTQFGKLIVAYKNWGDKSKIEEKGIEELTRIYVKFHEEAKNNDSLNDEARAWLLKMQNNDLEAIELWKWFNDISMLEFNRIYDRLNIKFDYFIGESFFNDKMDVVVDELAKKNLLVESEGAMIVDLEKYKMPPCLILRRDGGTLYPTRDIAAALYRKKTFDFDKCLYLTAVDQKLHFEQWFKVMELMGYDWSENLVHVYFGLVTLETGKLSTREGNVVLMEELLNEAVDKAKKIIEEKNPLLENKDLVARQVGIGSIIFNDLYNGRAKEVIFSWDRMLNFEGETAPYVQYAHARTNSLLVKGGEIDFENVDFDVLTDEASMLLVKLIGNFSEKIIEASNKYEPFILTRHLVDIAQAFNKFYHDNEQILKGKPNVKNAQLALVYSVKTILCTGLGILGIEAPNKM